MKLFKSVSFNNFFLYLFTSITYEKIRFPYCHRNNKIQLLHNFKILATIISNLTWPTHSTFYLKILSKTENEEIQKKC